MAATITSALQARLAALRQPLDEGPRETLPIQTTARWVLVAAIFVQINVEPGTTPNDRITLNALLAAAAAANALLALSTRRGMAVPVLLPVVVGIVDVVAITTGVAIVDGYENTTFILYFPAFVTFALVFPGRPSLVYTAATLFAYVAVIALEGNFDQGNPEHVKNLLTRLAALGVATLIANMLVRVERERRERAVREALAAHVERQRVSQEIHDSIAQQVYMLAASLEGVAELVKRGADPSIIEERLDALVRLAKHSLLDIRSVLFNLEPALAGEEGLVQLLRGQAEEFSAVTRIPVAVRASGVERGLEPRAVVEVYRVVQEALANTYKHAHASRVDIAVECREGLLSIRVADDGRGFEEVAPHNGHGLRGMRDRASALGGALKIESAAGKGTALTLMVPLRGAP